jgi:hypothetical protein
VSIVHPDGGEIRGLSLGFCPSEPEYRLKAKQNSEKVADSSKELLRLTPPFSAFLRFVRHKGKTTIHFSTYSEQSGKHDFPTQEVEGEEWNTGIVLFATKSPRGEFNVRLGKIVINGELSETRIEAVPSWQN